MQKLADVPYLAMSPTTAQTGPTTFEKRQVDPVAGRLLLDGQPFAARLKRMASTMATLFKAKAPKITPSVKKNIESVAQLEQEFERQRSAVACLSDQITNFVGRPLFVAAQLCFFAGWIYANTVGVFGIAPFDPYPFCFLGLCLACQTAFISSFILMSQKRQTRHADQWAHVALQVNLLSEQEMTKVLKLLRSICDQLGLETVGRDKELKEMVKQTHVLALVQELGKARDVNDARAADESDRRAA